jgi:3-isopropylmalate/(R)-2-methylmalate dehydratase large subunit
MSGLTLFDKIWSSHVVEDLDDGLALIYIDRHLIHDLSGPSALMEVDKRALRVHRPRSVVAMPDHLVSSAPDRTERSNEFGAAMWHVVEAESARAGIPIYRLGEIGQGIVHVSAPELGFVLPGMTVICGDSHTCTNGALGAVAFGVGSSQSAQSLATNVLVLPRPAQMRITLNGSMARGVTAKDVGLSLIARLGASAGAGQAVEYLGQSVEAMTMDERFTLCNLSVELGAQYGLIAPDGTTCDWIAERPLGPKAAEFDRAVGAWMSLWSDDDARFDRVETFDVSGVAPTVTWGTSPEHAIAIDGTIPDPASAVDGPQAAAWRAALDYMGLRPGVPIAGTPIDWVFIGSCANSRLSDLRAAAHVVRGRRVAPDVNAWVVAGSEQVRRQAEAEGLHRIFTDAGFEWRQPGCSLCVAANGDRIPPGMRCVSTSNRNFVGRQGPGARTHLASPATAAAAAVAGRLIDLRDL